MTVVNAELFDGASARPIPVTVTISGAELRVTGQFRELRYRLADLHWPERTRTGSRVFALPDGQSLHSRDDGAWHRLARSSGTLETRIVRWQQSRWRVAFSVLLLVIAGTVVYVWGVPWAARTALAFIPESVDEAVGRQALAQVSEEWLAPSQLPLARQAELRNEWETVLKRAWPDGRPPAHDLRIHASRIGPNAFALPGGTIILTDELVTLADGNTAMVVGVLAHELAHVQGRHSMRQLTQSTLIATLVSLAVGDVSSLAAGAPVILGNLAYTRELEREADIEAIRILQAAGIKPSIMADFFRKVEAREATHTRLDPGLLFSTHPGAEERIARFEAADDPAIDRGVDRTGH